MAIYNNNLNCHTLIYTSQQKQLYIKKDIVL